MSPLSARFAALLILCGIATSPLSSLESTGVHAAVIARGPRGESSLRGKNPDPKQAFFSSWSHKARRSSFKHKRPEGLGGRPHKATVTPSDQGSKYVVGQSRRAAGTPEWIANPGNQTNFNSTSALNPEGPSVNETGIVELVSGTGKDAKTVAYLTDGKSNGTDVLEATSHKEEASTMSLSSAQAPPNTYPPTSDDIFVNMCETTERCATYNRQDVYAQTIQLRPLISDSSDTNWAQLFSYNIPTNKLTPVSYAGNTGGSPKGTTASMGAASSNSTTTSAASRRRRDGPPPPSSGTQNVTLIFVPQKADSQAGAMNIKADASTSTVTQTVTVYSSSHPTPSRANVAAMSSTSSSGATASSAPSGNLNGMNVELVGGTPSSPSQSSSSTASSSIFAKAASVSSQVVSYSSSIVYGAASVTASLSASGSFNPAAIAASSVSSYNTAARYTASSAASPSGSGAAFGAASASVGPSAVSSPQPTVQRVLAAPWRREASPALETSNTDPYTWKFSPESR